MIGTPQTPPFVGVVFWDLLMLPEEFGPESALLSMEHENDDRLRGLVIATAYAIRPLNTSVWLPHVGIICWRFPLVVSQRSGP